MRYILVDQTATDAFTEEFETKEEAIAAGARQFNYLTESDLKERTAFYVLKSINPDEEAENHFDGEIVKEWL